MNTEQKFIAYYRVSTKEQGNSGLGLEAQRTDTMRYVNNCESCIINSYTEVESGKNDKRPQLINAIAECKSSGATLLIANLSRLSRNAAFIFSLRDAGVNFVCVDMPEANSLTIGLMAVLVQDERERISKRTKKALAQKKAQGYKLGSPVGFTESSRAKAINTKRNNALVNTNSTRAKKQIKNYIRLSIIDQVKVTNKSVCAELNEQGLKTTQGKEFTPNNVRYLLKQVLSDMGLERLPG